MIRALRTIVQHFDSWVNVSLGFGNAADKLKSTRYGACVPKIADGELTAMYRAEHLSAKIVDVYPREAYREGFELGGYDTGKEKGDPDGGTGGAADRGERERASKSSMGAREGERTDADEKDPDTEEAVCAYVKAWKVKQVCLTAAIWGRLYGGACVWMGSYSADPAAPFTMGERIDFLRIVDRRYLQARPWTLDPQGNPTLYDVIPHEGGSPVGPIHISRLVMFPGAVTDVQTRQAQGYWDDSVLQRPYDALRSDGVIWRSAEQLISEASLGILSIKGLYTKLAGPAREALDNRMALWNLTRSVAKNMTLDLEGEKYERVNTTFAGVSDLTGESVKRVASAAEIPVAILLSDEPSGLNATGDSSIRWWLMRVHAYRVGSLEEPTLYLCKALLAQSGIAGIQVDKLTIKWPNLWTPSAEEQADIYQKTTAADVQLIDHGVVTAEEIALSRFGEDGYSQETKIDRKLREPPTEEELRAAAEAGELEDPNADPDAEKDEPSDPNAPAPVGQKTGTSAQVKAIGPAKPGAPLKPGAAPAGENVQTQVLNGAQITSMIEVVKAAVAEEIPRESAQAILELALGLKPDQALRMLGPEDFEPKEVEPTNPFGGPPGGAPFGGKGAAPEGDPKDGKGKPPPFGKPPAKAPPKGE